MWTPDGRLLYVIDPARGNAVSYYHFDRTGSTLALTSAAGTVTDAYAYAPFGMPAAHTGASVQPFTYAGRYGVRYDPQSALYQMRARYYDPLTARFLSRDPVWPRPGDPLSLNPYNYAANNPLLYIDPTGAVAVTPQIAIEARYIGTSLSSSLKLGLRYDLDYGGAPVAADRGTDRAYGEPDLSPSRDISGSRMRMMPSGGLRQTMRIRPMVLLKPLLVDRESGAGSRSLSAFGVDNYRVNFSRESGPPQPIGAVSPFLLMNLSSEMMMVNAYGLLLTAQRHFNPLGVHSVAAYETAAITGIHPDDLEPRGVAFVNGQMVEAKMGDIIESQYWYDDFYDSLYCDYYPGEVDYILFRNWTSMGGSGGLYLNSGMNLR